MLPHLSRLAVYAANLRLTPQLVARSHHPHFPKNAAFFSIAGLRWNSTTASTISSSTLSSATMAPVTTESSKGNKDAPPASSNLDSHPESVSCTVSPPDTFAFLKPTPVVLLTGPFGGNWCYRDTWQATLADQGYQSTSVELSMPEKELETGDAYIRHFVKILKKSIETDHSFYPPILIAHGLHALVAQKYVESNPVSALVLVSPFIPGVIKDRFRELSRKLHATPKDSTSSITSTSPGEGAVGSAESAKAESTVAAGNKQIGVRPVGTGESSDPLSDIAFNTHADVLAQEGFMEKYVLPKKAVYKIDRVAQEHLEKEKEKGIEKEKETEKVKESLITKEEETDMKERQEKSLQGTTVGSGKPTSDSASFEVETITGESEKLGRDSVPIWETEANEEKNSQATTTAVTTSDLETEMFPVLTVESEASIPSPLEQLPLRMYDSIPTSLFEPTFPILLVTSTADEIVSTADVKTHHVLAEKVDHIELEDLDDGGHLIMVSDNAEWEQGIQGITAWLDSNGIYMEAYLLTSGHHKVHATYYLSRVDPKTGNRVISLVNQEDLKGAEKDGAIVSHHIYSLEPSPLKDQSVLSVSNAEATKLQRGKDINAFRIVQNKNVVISKSSNRPSNSTAPSKVVSNTNLPAKKPSSSTSATTSTTTPTTTTAAASKPSGPSLFSSASSSSATSKTLSTNPSSATNITSASSCTPVTSSSATTATTKPAPTKNSMISFFGKAGVTAKSASSAASTAVTTKPIQSTLKNKATSNAQKRKADSMIHEPRSTPQVSDDDDDDEEDSEEERDRRLALSSRLDQDQGPILSTKSSTAESAAGTADHSGVKKRQRSSKLLAVDDDDEEDEEVCEKQGKNLSNRRRDDGGEGEEDDEDIVALSKEARIALEKEKDEQRLALENMMLMDDQHEHRQHAEEEGEDSIMLDVETVDAEGHAPLTAVATVPSRTVTSSVSNGNGTITRRVRGHRAVSKKKTSVNARGYMVTETVILMEPFSEDEIVEEAPKTTSVSATVSTAGPSRTSAGDVSASKNPSATGPKKKAGSGNQSLLNFFSKK
ncbi:hypothetical protein BG004_006939 [Podila humilis]|nr:hypothetical protein BG004_006939 [Podila humilis]